MTFIKKGFIAFLLLAGFLSPLRAVPVNLVPSNLDSVQIFPNPWRADKHASLPITFDSLATNSTVKIFTLAGHWVKTLPISSSSVTWDLTNHSGNKVASGLYIYLITNDQNQKTTGQIAIIR